uniref:Uncharacterized protein n=1 Tax=Setaria italica TaxID=4555 RepID=K3ZFP7_SETIT
MEDVKGYTEDTKTAVQIEMGYTHKAQGYMTKASNSHPSLYDLRKRQGPSDTWLEAASSLVSNAKIA